LDSVETLFCFSNLLININMSMKLTYTPFKIAQFLFLFFASTVLFPLNTSAQFNDYRAFMEIGTSCDLTNDTYDDFGFTITNYSTNPTFNITQVRLNLSTAIMQDIFFDPNAQAGDQVGKGFTVNSGGTATGFTTASFSNFDNFHSGYRELIINFANSGPNNFGQFNTLSFSTDVDHSSLKFYGGLDNVGRISGLDLVGMTITVEFSDGTILTSQAAPVKDCAGKTEAVFSDACTSPGVPTVVPLSVPTQPTYTFDTTHTLRVLGLPNKDVVLYQVEGEMDFKENDHLPYPFDIDEHEENHFLSVKIDTLSLGNFGLVDVPVTIDNTSANGGRVHFFAVTVVAKSGFGKGGLERFCKSTVSNVVVLHYYEGICVNCGGSTVVAENEDIFQYDHYISGTGVPNDDYTLFNGITNTNDDVIFKTQWEGNLNYDIPMPNNDYELYCLFSENEYGVIFAPSPFNTGGAGDRMFKVVAEGVTLDNNLDIYATIGGASAALYRRYVISITDNKLDFNIGASFAPGVDAPVMSGFCVKPLILSVFPVEFGAFRARHEENQVVLDWSTLTELNNDRFEVERSLDGTSFSVLASVRAKGNSDRLQTYEAIDPRPQIGQNYYRIRQVDIDGGISFSQTVSVFVAPYSRMLVYPNPVKEGQTYLQLEGYEARQDVKIQLFSTMGQPILTEQAMTDEQGNLRKSLDVQQLAAGIYILHTITDKGQANSFTLTIE